MCVTLIQKTGLTTTVGSGNLPHMKKVKFTEIGYPAGNELIGDHMKAMVAKGKKHPNIKDMNESLRALEEMLRDKNLHSSKPAQP